MLTRYLLRSEEAEVICAEKADVTEFLSDHRPEDFIVALQVKHGDRWTDISTLKGTSWARVSPLLRKL